MFNQNGEVILKVLAKVGQPMTLDKIVMYISAKARVPPQEISETVRKTLNGGVQFGFVQKCNGEYYAETGGMGQTTGRRRCIKQKSKASDNCGDKNLSQLAGVTTFSLGKLFAYTSAHLSFLYAVIQGSALATLWEGCNHEFLRNINM
uniref:DUF4777 domain-containing protein n=2 Tax=Nemorhina TaxID=44051 RepID=A0A1B0BDC9_9MUSC